MKLYKRQPEIDTNHYERRDRLNGLWDLIVFLWKLRLHKSTDTHPEGWHYSEVNRAVDRIGEVL